MLKLLFAHHRLPVSLFLAVYGL
ncbi:hypothetical protein CP061683_1203A, partial [Chlamydia psittaci 06-1683]